MKTLSAIILLAIPVGGQGIRPIDSQGDALGYSKLLFVPKNDCKKEGARLAEDDMVKGVHFLLLQSGLAPVVYTSDKKFEQQFGVQYFDEGCSAPSRECMVAYNFRVFRYLQRNYAKTWWKDIRKDVVGFKEWRKTTSL